MNNPGCRRRLSDPRRPADVHGYTDQCQSGGMRHIPRFTGIVFLSWIAVSVRHAPCFHSNVSPLRTSLVVIAHALALLSLPCLGLAEPGSRPPLFSFPPTDIHNVAGVIPLGNTNPGGDHVLAVDHMYLSYPNPNSDGVDAYPVYAMAAGNLVVVQRIQHEGRADPDYQIYISHDRFVTTEYDHLHELSSPIEAHLASTGAGWWQPMGPDMAIMFLGQHGAPPPLALAAGAQVGRTKSYSASWDVGVIDRRVKHKVAPRKKKRRYPSLRQLARQLGYRIKAPYRGNDTLNAACFIDYMAPPMREQWFELLVSDPKTCGSAAWDVKGKLRGAWFNPTLDKGTPAAFDSREKGALSIIPDNYRTTTHIQIAIGSGSPYSALDPEGTYDQLRRPFTVMTDSNPTARVNPDPAKVGRATGTVCYDLSYNTGAGTRYNYILFRMTRRTRVAIKFDPTERSAPPCASSVALTDPDGTWSAIYVR